MIYPKPKIVSELKVALEMTWDNLLQVQFCPEFLPARRTKRGIMLRQRGWLAGWQAG